MVAYVLIRENAIVPAAHELQQFLLRSLPPYMIPAILSRLHSLPISANGKLDLTMLAQLTDSDLLDGTAAKIPASLTGF